MKIGSAKKNYVPRSRHWLIFPLLFLVATVVCLKLSLTQAHAAPQTFTVNSLADTNDGGTAAQVPSGSLSAMTYAIDTNFPGSGRGTLTFTDSKLGTFSYVVYLSSSSGGVIQDVSKNTVGDGNVQLQVGAPFSNSSLAGNYAFNFAGLGNNTTNL